VTHVDYSARIQTVAHDHHPAYYDLIRRFYQRTGCGVIVNTSFNVRGEPIVCTPYDAYRCFMRTDMDALVLENCLLLKSEQPSWPEAKGHLEREAEQPPAMPHGFLLGLRRIYATEFVPAGSSLGAQRLLRIHSGAAGPTMWKDADADESPKAIFAVSGAMDTAAPNPELMARAVTDAWAPGPVTDALRPVLASLIRLGQRYRADDALEEQVPESVYVMF
jgi:carbamoyltransferase